MSIPPELPSYSPKYQVKCDKDPTVVMNPELLQLVQEKIEMSGREAEVQIQKKGYYVKKAGRWVRSDDPVKNALAQEIWTRTVHHPKSKLVIHVKRIAPPMPELLPPQLPPISSNLLALIHGDSFIEKSGYEGGDVMMNMEFLLGYLIEIDIPGHAPLVDLLEDLFSMEQAFPLNPPRSLPDIRRFQQEMENRAQALLERTRALKPGEHFLMQGGWKSTLGGHAMLYMIERVSEEEYAFTLINTGAGIETHDSGLVGYKRKYNPIIRLHQIEVDRLAHPAFFLSLLELRCPLNGQGVAANHSAKEIYERILPSLGGIRDRAYEEQTALITTQKSGSCSWKSLTKWLQVEMRDRAGYKNFIFKLKHASLVSYFQAHPLDSLLDKEVELLKRSAEGFARFALRRFTEGVISSQELEQAEELTATILEAIKEQAKQLSLSQGIRQFEGVPLQYHNLRGDPPREPLRPSQESHATQRPLAGPLHGLKAPPPTLQAFNQLLEDLLPFCHQLAAEGNDRVVIQTIKNFIKIIPPGAFAEKGYLAQLSEGADKEAIEMAMNHLLATSQLLFSSIAALDESLRGSPEQMGMMSLLLAINERLSHLAGDRWMTPLGNLLLNWESNPFAIIYDESLNQLFQEGRSFLLREQVMSLRNEIGKNLLSFLFNDDGALMQWYGSSDGLKSFIDQLVENDPDCQFLKGNTDREVFAVILPEISQSSFPASLRTLFAQYHLLDYFDRNPHLKEVRREAGQTVGSVFLIPALESRTELSYHVGISGISGNTLPHEEIEQVRQRERLSFEEGQKRGQSLSFGAAHTPISHAGIRTLLQSVGMVNKGINRGALEDIHRWEEAPYAACYLSEVAGLSNKQTREIAFMLSKKATFIPHLLSYLREHPGAFTERAFQLLIHHFFYGMHALEESLERFPESGALLTRFLTEQLELYKRVGDIQVELYLLGLLMRLAPLGLTLYPTLQAELLALSRQVEDHTIEGKRLKALIYAQFLASHYKQEELTREDLVQLSVAYTYLKTYGYNAELSYPHIKEQMEEVIDRVAQSPFFQEEGVAEKIVEGISREVLSLPRGRWQGSFPLFQEMHTPFRIDLSTFSIFEGPLLLGGMPSQIANHPSFIHLFSSKNYRVQEVRAGLYSLIIESSTGQEEYLLFQHAANHKVVIQRRGEEGWFTYLPPEEVRSFTPEALVEGCSHWLFPSAEGHFQILIESAETKKRLALIEGRIRDDNSWWVERCTNEEGLELHRADLPLSAFEEEGFFLNWGSQHLEFPRKKIHFERGEEGRFYFSENRKLFLSPVQSPPSALPLFKGMLKIEDEEGNPSFLFPREPIDLSKKQQGALDRASQVEYRKKQGNYFQIPEKEGILTGSTPQENLFLAYLHLSEKNYPQAYRLLDLYLVAHPKGYSPDEIEILEWIFALIDQLADPSPHSCAVELQILYLANRYLPSALKEKPPFHLEKRLTSTLARYYPMAHHITTLSPSPQQELELLEASLIGKIPGAHARYRYLQGVVEEQEARPISRTPPAAVSQRSRLPARADSAPEQLSYTLNRILSSRDHPLKKGFLFHGEDYLASHLESFLADSTSELPAVRQRVITTLALLKCEDLPELKDILTMLRYVAQDATQEEREELAKSWFTKGRLADKLRLLHDMAYAIEERVDSLVEAPQAPLPPLANVEGFPPRPLPPPIPERLSFAFPPVTMPHPPSAKELLDQKWELPEVSVELPAEAQEVAEALDAARDDNRVVQHAFARTRASIHAYMDEQQEVKRYRFTDRLEEMEGFFGQKAEEMTLLKEELEQELLSLANKESLDPIEQLVDAMRKVGSQKKELSLDELIILYLQNRGERLQERNPHLTKEDLTELTQLLHRYLLIATESSHLARVHTAIQETLHAEGAEREDSAWKLDSLLRAERAYPDLSQEKVALIFEYYSNTRLRKNQAELLAQMSSAHGEERQHFIAELIMGSGKSKVIMPLLAFLLSDGKTVPVVVVPDMLYETNLEDMRTLSGTLLRQSPYTLVIPEGGRLTLTQLDEILLKREQMQQEAGYFLFKESTVKELILDFKETCAALGAIPPGDQPPQALEERYYKLQTLLNKLLQTAIFDEADMLFDHLKEMNFSSGQWQNLSSETQDSMEEIFLAIAEEKELAHFFQLDKESAALFDQEEYEKRIKPALVEIILQTAHLGKIAPAAKKALLHYLLSDPEIREIPPFILSLDKKAQNHLALGKELIANLFPHTLHKNCDEHFGISHERNSFQAIPYLRSNTPSEGSEFSSPFETMLYTTYYYARRGVGVDQIKQLMRECKEHALQEHTADGIPFEETQGFQRFQALQLIPGKDLFSIQESEIEKAVTELNKDIRKRIAFSRAFGWREIGVYPRRLSCNAHHLAGAFSSVMGFTGTLWNGGSFPYGLNPRPAAATEGKTLALLKESQPQLHSYSELSDLYSSLENYQACIDTGAWFRGIAAKTVALTMLEHLPSKVRAVVYFNDLDIPPGTKGQAVVIERGKENAPPKLLSKAAIPEEERFTYYNLTTGADISQVPFAKALLTVGKNMALRDLLQGAWRMRGLDKTHKVDFALPQELPLRTFEEIVLLLTRNQARRESSDNVGSLKKQIAYVAEELILKALRDPRRSIQEAISLSRAAEAILSPALSMEPFALFGAVEEEVSIEEIQEKTLQEELEKLRAVYAQVPYLENYASLAEIEASMRKRSQFAILPAREKLKRGEEYGMAREMRQKMQTEQETQVALQLEVVQETLSQSESFHTPLPLPLDNVWNNDYWRRDAIGNRSVNEFLIPRKKELSGFDPNRRVFSEQLRLTGGVAPLGASSDETKDAILFQRGSMPITTCALKIFPDGSKEMIFLDPNQAEFLAILLKYKKEYRRAMREKDLDSLILHAQEFLFAKMIKEMEDLLRGQDLREVAQEEGKTFDKKELWEQFRENWPHNEEQVFQQFKDLFGFAPYATASDAAKLCREANIPFIWNKPISFIAAKHIFDGEDHFNLLLVDPKIGILHQGKPEIDEEELLRDPEYALLSAQAKFYNGDLDSYTPFERKALREWIVTEGKEVIFSLLSNILRARPEEAARYPHSVLHKIFQ